jgi:hypothetical protein
MKTTKPKLTFKKHIPTGRFRSFEPEVHDVKLKGQLIGHISEISSRLGEVVDSDDFGKFRISLKIKKEVTEENPAAFKWIFFKKRFESAKEAREWLNEHTDSIVSKYDIYQFEK